MLWRTHTHTQTKASDRGNHTYFPAQKYPLYSLHFLPPLSLIAYDAVVRLSSKSTASFLSFSLSFASAIYRISSRRWKILFVTLPPSFLLQQLLFTCCSLRKLIDLVSPSVRGGPYARPYVCLSLRCCCSFTLCLCRPVCLSHLALSREK